jgi:hypothetical protein
MRRRHSCLLLAVFAASFIMVPRPVTAQSLGAQLADLLTSNATVPPTVVQDASARSATFAAVAGLLAVELTNLPVSSSSGGFVYRLNPALGTVERASQSFGPFFTERAVRTGANQLSLGLAYQDASFSTLQGADLTAGTFPTNAARMVGTSTPFNVDTLRLDLDARSVTGLARYGISNSFDVGVQVPIVQLRFTGVRVNSTGGTPTFNIVESGSATGLGDMTVTARYRVYEARGRGLALGSDLKLPTGRSEDLLGAGTAAVRSLVIGSVENGRWAGHANAGIGAGGASGEILWGGAVTYEAATRVTIVGELFGRRLRELHKLVDVYQPHPTQSNVETMRWVADDGGVSTSYAVAGAKWNVGGSAVLNASLLMRLTDAGLRARVTPSISMDYAFEGLRRRR